MAAVTDGVGLAREYHRDVVAPILLDRWPRMPFAAGRLGSGSDVLGLDDETSRDHDWGLRLTLLVEAGMVAEVDRYLEENLPDRYAGWPTRFATTWDRRHWHRAQVTTAETFTESRLGLDLSAGLSGLDWLCLTGQSVLEVVAGAVFQDQIGTITRFRQELAWYPDDVWRYVVATDWIRLGEDLPLLGRTGQRGDELGRRVLAGRVVNTAIHLAFRLSRAWAPYPKWLGTAFAELPLAGELTGLLAAALTAPDWRKCQQAVALALAVLYRQQAEAGLATEAGEPTEPFFDRPFLSVRAGVCQALLDAVDDPQVRGLRPGVGSVEQWMDNVRVLADAAVRVRTARAHLLATSTSAHHVQRTARCVAGRSGS
jgi:hypothetical protein